MLHRRQFLQLAPGAISFSPKSPTCLQKCLQGCRQFPKFWFGDYVYEEQICDDDLDPDNFGKPLRDYGVITGLFFSGGSRHYAPGWNYFVSWRWVGGEATNNSDWDSAVHESELKLSDRSLPKRCC